MNFKIKYDITTYIVKLPLFINPLMKETFLLLLLRIFFTWKGLLGNKSFTLRKSTHLNDFLSRKNSSK